MLGARAECEESGTERPDVAKRPKRGGLGLAGAFGDLSASPKESEPERYV